MGQNSIAQMKINIIYQGTSLGPPQAGAKTSQVFISA